MHRPCSLAVLLLSASVLLGCFPRGDPSQPIPTARVPATTNSLGPDQRLVIVLPGRGDDLDGLRRSGIAQAIHAAWPDADVLLTGLALGYYMENVAERRLHEELVRPARERYRQVWLVGASLGGMGAILYDRAYPGEASGLVLLAPYLGEPRQWAPVAHAGGIARWQPPPRPTTVNGSNFVPEMWRQAQGWLSQPDRTATVWLAYGRKDRFAEANALLAPALPPAQVLVREGGHDWNVWAQATQEVLRRVDARARPS